MVAAERTSQGQPRARSSAEGLRADLRTVASKKAWFGHHSVGSDILAGAQMLARETGVDIVIGEGPIGENGKPLEKIKDFEREAQGNDAHIVVMKLCYADFTPHTDARALADAYAAAVDRVRRARPEVRIVHVTPPLTVRTNGTVARLSRALGRPVWDDRANQRRLEYAEQMVARFPGEPVFDLGLLESTREDGARELHLVDGALHARVVPFLWAGWSSDGGHLNSEGKRMAARAFIRALAEVSQR